ncbi:MAG: helix-turn-helix transcriptional regulator [bacterium]|nr:helix-turn-helix transcriptional regulator [bacterium]
MVKGDRLRELRKSKGLTQGELGEMIGVKKSVICLYERELRNPTIESVIQLCEIFDVDADYLIGSDKIVKTDNSDIHKVMTSEEVEFIEELRKNTVLYRVLLNNPKRGIELVRNKLS